MADIEASITINNELTDDAGGQNSQQENNKTVISDFHRYFKNKI